MINWRSTDQGTQNQEKNFKSIRRSRVENKGNFLIGVEMNATDSPNSK